jgi:hypothetical protein
MNFQGKRLMALCYGRAAKSRPECDSDMQQMAGQPGL